MPESKNQAAITSQNPPGLRRELGLADIALAQILYLTIPEFFGTAAKAGASHVLLWMLAILLFFIPEALVVARLNRLMPLEGGLYSGPGWPLAIALVFWSRGICGSMG